jgi:hypothetical protein
LRSRDGNVMRPRYLTFTALLVALMLPLIPVSPAQAAQAGRDYGESVRALKQKKYDKAEEKIREALKDVSQAQESILISGSTRYPYLPYYVLGAALHGQGDCPGALEAWQESLRQGHVRNSAKEFSTLQAGMTDCGSKVAQSPPPASQTPEPVPVADEAFTEQAESVAQSLDELKQANSRYSNLAQNPDLKPEWNRDWKRALDVSEQEWRRLQAELDEAVAIVDASAIKAIASQARGAFEDINAGQLAAEQRIDTLEAQRVSAVEQQRAAAAEQERLAALERQRSAQVAEREKERKRQEELDEQRRIAATNARKEADKRKLAQEERERVTVAQRGLRQELDSAWSSLNESLGDERVLAARSQLASLSNAGEALMTSTNVDGLNKQALSISDGLRRYNQAVQEWEAQRRQIELRTPPPELRSIAEAYFAGDYETVSRLAEPRQFTDKRHMVQTYLFRSAALFNRYWLTGQENERLIAKARSDVAAIKRLDRDFVPYVAAFSPKYLEFFRDS